MIQPSTKGKACTVMVWATFCGIKRSQLVYMPGNPEAKCGGVISTLYLEVLEEELPMLQEPDLFFMQDNASIYTAGLIKNQLKEEGIAILEQLLHSPDLNPIKYAWK